MAGLCGWINHKQDEQAPNIVSMAATLGRFDGAVAQTQGAAWCQLAAAGLGSGPFAGEDGAYLIAFAGAPGFPDHEWADVARQSGLLAALAAGYRRWRDDLAKHLTGQYSISVVDREQRSLYLAVDRFATHPVVFRNTAGGLMFGSTLDALVQGSDRDLELDPQAIFNYVYFHVIPGPDTVYSGVRRLLAGESLTFQNEKLSLQTYWAPVFEEQHKAPFAELKQGFLGALRNAVKTTSEGEASGCFLSGGTDSSTIAGLLGEVSGAPARTYSIGFEAAGYDEMEYARIAAKQFNTDHHEYYVTPADVADAIPRIAQVYDQPFGNSSAVPTYFCARFAQQDGIRKLLGGDGGDELYGGNERYAKQHVFSHYDRVPGVLKGLLEPVLFNAPGADNIATLRKAKSYVEQAKLPMPARLETYNLLDRFGIGNVFSADFLARVRQDQPIQHLSNVYHGTKAATLLNRMLALDFKITLTDNDLPKVSRMCELAKVDVAYPMLDDRVLDFSLRLAPELKMRGTTLRYFFKEALRGFLPDAIINKQKHGFGLPFGPWLKDYAPLQQIAYGSLERLGERGIIRKEFVGDIITAHRTGHADYYGTMVWVLMMLELWLEQHKRR